MKSQVLFTHAHATFALYYHLVFVTKYRKKVITNNILCDLKEIFEYLCKKWNCQLIEFNGEQDHVHLLIAAHPDMNLSVFVNNLKTVSSRLIRKKYKDYLSAYYYKPFFWKKAYCIISVGGAPLEILKQYIENQNINN